MTLLPRFVVEPAVAVKCFVPEKHSTQAARLLDGGNELLAPATLLTEAAGIVLAKIRLGEVSEKQGMLIMEALESVPVRTQTVDFLMEPALSIAAALDVPFRHGIDLAAAVREDCRLVTADGTLYDRVQGTPFAVHVKWVGDIR